MMSKMEQDTKEKQNPIVTRFLKVFTPSRTVILIFILYLAIGFLIVNDYGISWDELTEHHTSLINCAYVAGTVMRTLDSEFVLNIANRIPALTILRDRLNSTITRYLDSEFVLNTVMLTEDSKFVRNVSEGTAPDLMYLVNYEGRFYGVALQMITVLIEFLRGFSMSSRNVYLMRHIFTFLNYYIAGFFFYLILRRRFGNTYIPLFGALFFILFPRFFGEAFYNIKDILFYAWFIIAAYFVLLWLENEKAKYALFAAATLAVATNTRILGLSLLLLACAFAIIKEIQSGADIKRIILKPLTLFVLAFAFYIVITPALWEHPLKNFVAGFSYFRQHPWPEKNLYLGELITSEVPWHYIPVWMGITVPLLYIVMFTIGVAVICVGIRINRHTLFNLPPKLHLYDLFFASLFFCTLFGFIILRIKLYDGWRQVYSIFCPFLYIVVYGLERTLAFVRDKNVSIRRGFACAVAVCLLSQFAWIVGNHQYQYVFFNILGRQVAEKNFDLDYWGVSHYDLIRYALANDDRSQITVSGSTDAQYFFLTEDEKESVFQADTADAEYYLQRSSSAALNDRIPPPGFTELTAIFVNGMKISTLYKRVQPQFGFDGSE